MTGSDPGAAAPYKGLSYYAERDSPFFFGREQETSIIAANLLASALTVLYGASGVGKSSLLRAGVARHLRELARDNIRRSGIAGAVVVVFPADEEEGAQRRDSWRDDPIAGLANGIERAVAELGLEVEPVDRSLRFAELLEAWSERLDGDVLLILDQFEEYFLYHGGEEGQGTFAEELPRALVLSGAQANVLISIREDAYARLDSFKGRIPFLYDNYLRVDHLDREAARAAIERPIEQYNRLVAPAGGEVTIEPELVDAVLEDVQAGSVVLGQSGRGSVDVRDASEARIETPFLQLVLERLWNEEVGSGSRVLRLETLERLGGADRVVRTHLDAAMAELSEEDKALAARAFRQLVTPSGTKIAHLASDLAALEDAPSTELGRVLERLAAARILRPIAPPSGQTEPRYEIFHDVLAPAILDWRARYLQAAQDRARERRRRRRIAVGGGSFAALACAAVAAAVVLFQSQAGAKNEAEAEAFLNDARAAIGFAGVFVGHGPMSSAAFSPDQRRVLTAGEDGTLRLWDTVDAAGPKGGTELSRLENGPLSSARFGPTGDLAVTAGRDGAAVWSLTTRRKVPLPVDASEDAAFSPDGRLIAVAGDDGIARILTWPDLRTITRIVPAGQSELRSIEFSPDGLLLAAASDDGMARIWTIDGRRLGTPLRASASDSAYDASFSASGRFLVTAGQDGTARIWQVGGDRPLAVLRAAGHASLATAAFSPDERFVVTAGGDVARVWEWRRDQSVMVFRGHRDGVTSASFNESGSLVVTSGNDGTARLWAAALPDLALVTPNLALIRHGAAIRVSFDVTNLGGGAAGTTSARVSSRGFAPVTLDVPALRPGASAPGEAELPIPASARGRTADFAVTVNPERNVVETGYENNHGHTSTLILAPDLHLVTESIAPTAGAIVVTVRVENIGRGPSGPTAVVSSPPGYARVTATLAPLGPGASTKLKLTLRPGAGARPGQQAAFTVDPNGTSGDRDTRNNTDLTQPLYP